MKRILNLGFILAMRILFLTMRFWCFLLISLLPTSLFGQLIVNQNREQLADEIVFNPDFIRANKIKSINGRFSYKRAGSIMRETNFWQVFEFDTLGRILQSYETRKDDGTPDTVWTKYFYNDKGLLIYQSTGNTEFFKNISTVYTDEKQIVLVEEFERKPDIYGIPVTKEVRIDRFSYQELNGKIVKTRSNKQGTPYAKITPYFNDYGQLIREEDRYISTNEGLIYTYEYDLAGNLIQQQTLTSKQGIQKEATSFKYDEKGNMLEKKKYLENQLKTEKQFIFSESSGLLSAILTQEGGSSNITILRIKEYEYY